MSLNDAATLVIGAGNYFTGPAETDCPADLTVTPASPWANLGHTSIEDIFSIESEGGEAKLLQTLQSRSLRTIYSARSETIKITLQQFDAATLKLYFGSNAPVLPDGMIGSPEKPQATVGAFLAIFLDGETVFAIYAPKAEFYRADDLSAGDTESLAGLPIGVKPVAAPGNSWTYAVTPLGTV